MKHLAVLVIAFLLPVSLFATTSSFDDTFPSDILTAVSAAADRYTDGRGSIDFLFSDYSEDSELFPDELHASFTVSYSGKSYTINATGRDRASLISQIDEEISAMLYYEELLLAPGLRLDYIFQSSYSALSDTSFRRGTRFKAVDSNGHTRGIFDVTGRYNGATTLDPVYLDRPFPGISLEPDGTWTAYATAAMGFAFPQVDVLASATIGKLDWIFPFIPTLSFVYRYRNGVSYMYGGIGVAASLSLGRIFPSVEFTLIQEGRIGADASLLLGGSSEGFDWNGRFSVFYEHRATPHFYWRIGYENFGWDTHMLMIGFGGDF